MDNNATNASSYDEFTLNFKLEDNIAINTRERDMFNYEFVGNRTTVNEVELNGMRALQYVVPATLPLEPFLTKQLYKGEFLAILSNILNQLMYFEENGMPLNKLFLDFKYMYIELSTMDVQLLYMPVEKNFPDVNITKFIQDIIMKVRFADMSCVDLVDTILQYLDSKLMFNLRDFYHFILSLEAAEMQADERDNSEAGTTVLATSSNYENPIPYLVRIKTNELIPIIRNEFVVGKSHDCDYQITDNRKVSRRHATFRISNGECYIRDNSSTNHTFINGKLLQPEFEIMLSNNDYIRFGDEEFKYWVR